MKQALFQQTWDFVKLKMQNWSSECICVRVLLRYADVFLQNQLVLEMVQQLKFTRRLASGLNTRYSFKKQR